MAVERTFGIVKPDAVGSGVIGGVVDMIERSGLRIVGLRYTRLDESEARGFYAVHAARPFFKDLVAFMTSGPCVLMAIEGDNAISRYRELMGPTDAAKAPPGTIRHKYGQSIEKNAVHGSDGAETAKTELSFFFAGLDLLAAGA